MTTNETNTDDTEQTASEETDEEEEVEETYVTDPDSIPAERNDPEDLGFGDTKL